MRIALLPSLLTWTCCSLACLFVPGASLASEGEGHTYALFDGKTLDGWTVENDCEAVVEDGMILLKAGNGWLRSHHTYADFKLRVEWKALQAENYDAGIYLRAGTEGDPFPKQGYQANLLQGKEGQIGDLAGAVSSGLVKPAGQWNTFDFTVVGETVALKINGEQAYRVSGMTVPRGHIGIQLEVPTGGQFLIRNVRVTELGYRSLFNGEDFTGWEGAGEPAEKCWEIEDGILTVTDQPGPSLRSLEEFDDFNLRLEYRVAPGANSGVFIRLPESGNYRREDETQPPAGFEVQILDDSAPKYADLKNYQYSGSVYAIAGPSQLVSKPPGEWNTLEINCKGYRVTNTHNGVVIVEADAAEHPPLKLRELKGFLGLQRYTGGGVSFRNIRIGPPVK